MASFFFGRVDELRRLRALAEEPVALIYGLPGIGKSELAYHAAAELRSAPPWQDIPIVRVTIEPHNARVFHSFLHARITGRGCQGLSDLVALLAKTPHVVVLDNAHHAPNEIAALVDELVREVEPASRLIVTSRTALPVVTTPIVIRLGPLAKPEARSLAEHFATRLGMPTDGLDPLVEHSGGSPFLLRHLVAGSRRGSSSGDPLEETINILDSDARQALIRLAAVADCSRSRLAAARLVPDDRVFNTLAEQFLVDSRPEELVIHELVREVVMSGADRDTIASSRRTAAQVLWEDFERHSLPLVAVESICLSVSAGDIEQAFASLRAAIQTISGAGLDHLLVPTLERLSRDGRPEATLALARIYLRMARIDDAAQAIEALPPERDHDLSALMTRATIAERRCRVLEARSHLAAALEVARDPRMRALVSMRLAIIETLSGEPSGRKRIVELEHDPAITREVDRVRLCWARGVVHALHLEWIECLSAVSEGRRIAQAAAIVDLDFLLMLLELLAASELGDVTRAEELGRDTRLVETSAHLRGRMSELYVGVSQVVCGRLDEAVVTLEHAYVEHERQHDELLACLAGHFLGRALALHGEAARSVEVLTDVSQRATAAKLVPLISPGRAHLGRALLTVGRVSDAEHIARDLRDHPLPAMAAESAALQAYVHVFRGDIELARTEIARALEIAGDREPLRTDYALDQAYIELFGGDPERARATAVAVIEDESRRRRPYSLGRALLVTAIADVAAGIYDTALASLARIDELAKRHGLHFLHARAALLRSATSHGGTSILERVPAEQQQGYVGLLRVLGLRPETVIVSSRHGRLHTEHALLREVAREHDLLIDLSTGSIIEKSGRAIEGRGVASAILVALAESPDPVNPERLYQIVWGGTDYHPLRHRNTLYIALNRTRKLLDELVGDREIIIRRDPTGWAIAPDVDIAVARRDPRVSTVTGART